MTEQGMGSGSRKRSFFDDVAGVAGGAFSALTGVKAEAEAMARAQMDAMVTRLDLVRREDLDAAMEVARRASDAAAALAARVTALEEKLATMEGATNSAYSTTYIDDPQS